MCVSDVHERCARLPCRRRLLPPGAEPVDLLQQVFALAAGLGGGQLRLELAHLFAPGPTAAHLDLAFNHAEFPSRLSHSCRMAVTRTAIVATRPPNRQACRCR